MIAIVSIAGKQYTISENSVIDVDRLSEKEGETVEFSDVLLNSSGEKVALGSPAVTGSKVVAKVVKHFRADKIHVRRFKSKVRYRKSTGFRAERTRLHITKIS